MQTGRPSPPRDRASQSPRDQVTRSTRLPITSGTRCTASPARCTASPACFTTVVATRFARATGDCFRARLRPGERFRADDFRAAAPRADDLRRDIFRAADFRPPVFLRADFLPADRRPRDERALPRDDRFFVAMALLSELRVECSRVSARIARAATLEPREPFTRYRNVAAVASRSSGRDGVQARHHPQRARGAPPTRPPATSHVLQRSAAARLRLAVPDQYVARPVTAQRLHLGRARRR